MLPAPCSRRVKPGEGSINPIATITMEDGGRKIHTEDYEGRMRTLPNDSFGSVAVIYIVGNECRLSTLSRHSQSS